MILKKWILKAIVQKVISVLPFSFRINYFFQRFVTRRVRISDEFLLTMIEHHKEAVHHWKKHGGKLKGSRIIELGTGWHPVIPVLHFLCGADEIHTVDLRPLLRKENLHELLYWLVEKEAMGKLKELTSFYDPGRLQTLQQLLSEWSDRDLQTILKMLHIHQWIGDAVNIPIEDEYFQFCTSVNVLEHVSEDSIGGIMKELSRLTMPGGFHYHAIGTYDHFVHVDNSISKFNYLKYSKSRWKLIDNSVQPQNRLRLSWFRDLFSDLGYEIREELLWDAEPEELAKIELHSDFKDCDLADVPYGTYLLKLY